MFSMYGTTCYEAETTKPSTHGNYYPSMYGTVSNRLEDFLKEMLTMFHDSFTPFQVPRHPKNSSDDDSKNMNTGDKTGPFSSFKTNSKSRGKVDSQI